MNQNQTKEFEAFSPLLLDSVGAAKMLGLQHRTLMTLHYRGQGPKPIKIGRYLRWSPDRLRAWVEQKFEAANHNASPAAIAPSKYALPEGPLRRRPGKKPKVS
jgi:predicted DNA-binding transcriptional regulator AlpA